MEKSKSNFGSIDPVGTQTLQVLTKAGRFNEWMYHTILPFLQAEILEIGSGLGNISKYAIRDKLTITLSDINPEYQQFLKEKFLHSPNVRNVLSIDLQQQDFFNSYKDLKERYDTIFLLNVIEHLKNDAAAIENCHFMLKKGGNLVILAPAYPSLYCRFDKELGHYKRYIRKSLIAAFPKPLFSISHSQYFNFVGIAGWFLFGKVLRKKRIGSDEMSIYEKLVPFFKIIDKLTLKRAGLSVIVTGRKNKL
jgi:SAM-dependent methyltransferase